MTRGLAAACLALVAATAAAEPARLAAFEGAWQRAELERDDAARRAEVDRVTASMSRLTRGVARALIRRSTRPDDAYVITREGDVLRVVAGGAEHSRLRPDGVTRATEDGEVVDRLRDDGSIERRWRHGEDAYGATVWQLSPDGRWLRLRITAANPRFDDEIGYTTTYRRVDP